LQSAFIKALVADHVCASAHVRFVHYSELNLLQFLRIAAEAAGEVPRAPSRALAATRCIAAEILGFIECGTSRLVCVAVYLETFTNHWLCHFRNLTLIFVASRSS
jgi:hypothetical protein